MRNYGAVLIYLLSLFCIFSPVAAQRMGGLPEGSISNRILISNGPKGPIRGGESAVTDMILMPDGWVYGSTEATWGAENCHLFKTDGESAVHVLNVSVQSPGQVKIMDLEKGPGGLLFGCTSTYNDIFDKSPESYEGGHIFSYDPVNGAFTDFGVVSRGSGINCIAVDTARSLLYGVTYPSGRLFSLNYATKTIRDFGEIMTPWRVKHLGKVSWRGVPKTLMINDAGTVYFSTYYRAELDIDAQELMKGGQSSISSNAGGRIYRLAPGDDKPAFTGAAAPVQKGMDTDPIYENGIASAIRANDGGFWCGTINDGFLFKFYPSTSTVINKGKAFQYWNLKSLAYGGDGRLYMLGGRDDDNSWLLRYDTMTGSMDSLGWPDNTTQCGVICADAKGRILIAENLRHSFIWVYNESQ